MGFHAPTTHWEERVHVRLSPAPRFCRGVCPRVPPRRLRCRSQVFPTSQRPSSSPHRPTIFRWVAFMGFALQGVVPSTKPRRLVAVRPTLLTLLPRADRSPFLGGDTRRRGGSYLGAFNRRLLSSTGSSSSWKSIGHTIHFHSGNVRPAPLGLLTSSWCAPERNGEGFPPLDRRASRARGRRLPPTRCPPRLSDHPGRPTLTSGPSHPKVSRLHPPPPFGVPPAAGLSVLRPFALIRGTPSPGPVRTSLQLCDPPTGAEGADCVGELLRAPRAARRRRPYNRPRSGSNGNATGG